MELRIKVVCTSQGTESISIRRINPFDIFHEEIKRIFFENCTKHRNILRVKMQIFRTLNIVVRTVQLYFSRLQE